MVTGAGDKAGDGADDGADRVFYRSLLRQIHWHLLPRTYVEIGVFEGASLRLVTPATRALGVDPDPQLTAPPDPNVTVLHQTSDAFFARGDLDDLLGHAPIDLAFVDGLHQFECALRDVMNIERHAHPGATILLHDCHPIDAETSTREQSTAVWAGDVWKVILILEELRPDLDVLTLDAAPTGLGVIRGLDPTSRVLDEHYDAIVERYLGLDYARALEGEVPKSRVLNVRPVRPSSIAELWPDAPLQPYTPALRLQRLAVDGPTRARSWVKRTPIGSRLVPAVRRIRSAST